MGLYDRLKSDNARIVSGEDMQDVTLFNASGISAEGKARVTSPGMNISPQGQIVATKKNTVGFHIDNFSSIVGAGETFKNWQCQFLNSQGETVRGRFNNPLVDKTLGYVVVALTDIKEVG